MKYGVAVIGVQQMATLGGASVPAGVRVTDLVVQSTGAGVFLYAATSAEGILGFGLGAGAVAVGIGSVSYAPGADVFGQPRLDVLDHDGQRWLLPGGRFPAELTGFSLSGSGTIGGQTVFSDGPGGDFSAADLAVIDQGGTARIFAADPSGTGLAAWSIAPGSTDLVAAAGFADGAGTYLASPSVLTSAVIGGQGWVFAGSAAEHGITALKLAPDGSLAAAGSVGAAEGLGLNAPGAIEVVSTGVATYLVVADTGSSSLSVLRVDPDGLTATDHVVDTLATRFQGATALSALSVGDRAYIAVGGADDGVSLFRLLPDGRLYLETTIVDTPGAALADVAALQLAEVGGQLQLFV
ncbi:MAG: hypothetical protein KDE06_06115, partial [Rhodobacteraceae bacterium]|nr:hypothetical protein [Paracoccaceae bacterium]